MFGFVAALPCQGELCIEALSLFQRFSFSIEIAKTIFFIAIILFVVGYFVMRALG